MSFLSNIARSVVNPVSLAQLAMGPAGWASLAVRTIGAAVGKELIQALGQQLGLPQGVISMAQNAFSAATGTTGGPATIAGAVSDLAQQFDLSPMQQGQLNRTVQQGMQDIYFQMQDAVKQADQDSKARTGSNGKGSWLQVIADSMSKVLDKKIQDMDKLAQALDKQGSNRSVKSSQDLTVAGQEFQYLMNAASTVIKGIGEGLSSMARKQ